MPLVIMRLLKQWGHAIRKENLHRLIVAGLASLFICSTIYMIFESKVDEQLTYGDALWWGIVTSTTVGYGDYFPITPEGRIASVLLMFTGISIFGFVTASIASIFIEQKLRKGAGLMHVTDTQHTVIVGWNAKSQLILDELIQSNPQKKYVIIDKIERLELPYKNVQFVHGDPTKDDILKKANIPEADCAIVVGDQALDQEGMIDAKSVLICLAIDTLNPTLQLIAEVLNEENLDHFRRANVNETVISTHTSSRLMVRSALSPHVGLVMKELMTNSYGNEIYEMPVAKELHGAPFHKVAAHYHNEHNCIVIGLAGKETVLNPDKNQTVQHGDAILYIGQNALKD